MRESPHPKDSTEHEAKEFGDADTGDYMDGGLAEGLRGVGGFRYCLNLRDLGTSVKMAYPVKTRSEAEALECLKLFGGDPSAIKRFYCDNDQGLVAAAKSLDILVRNSQPGRHQTNAIAERCNQDILHGAHACLAAAGLPDCFWTFAAPYYCLMEDLTYDEEGRRLYEKWAGEDFKAKIIPFGALVEYIPPETRKEDHSGKWGARSAPGVFAGYELGEKSRWNKKYLVWNLWDF